MTRRGFFWLAASGSLCYAGPLEERIRRIERRWRPVESMATERVPAVSIAVIREGQIEWARAYGVAVTTGTLFQGGAVGKPLTAMAALHMAQYGNFGLDEPVNAKLESWRVPESEFTLQHPVTVRGILSHTAGLTTESFPGYGEDEEVPGILEILDGRAPAKNPPVRVDTVPGAQYRYSEGGYTVLQVLLEDRFGKSFPELMRRIVLQRLAMHTSTFEQPLPAESASRAAVGFHENGRSYTGGWHRYPASAAQGLWTTPIDLAKFLIEVQKSLGGSGGKVIERDMAKLLAMPAPGVHALGMNVRPGWFGHSGVTAGYRSEMWATADGTHGVALMMNSDGADPLKQRILAAISAESGWPNGLS